MYSVSNEYRAKMLDQVQTHFLKGYIDEIEFSADDVIGVSYINQCSDKNVNLGSVFIGTLKLTFLKNILERGEYYGKTIELYDGLLTGYDENDDPIVEYVPIGVFYVAEAIFCGASMIEITAYDVLSKLDQEVTIDQTSGKLYNFCKYIETETGAIFGMTENETDQLINGDVIIAPYFQNDISTFRDLLSALAVMIGGFAYADRTGKWQLKAFNNVPVVTVPNNRRFSGMKISDFETRFDCLAFVYVPDENRVIYIGDPEGYVMNIGANPFLQYGTQNTDRAEAIFQNVQLMQYTPFDVSLLPAFIALDLGDVISFSNDYTGETSSGAVMKLAYNYNKSIRFNCFGSNPNLRDGKSAADNTISGLSKNTKTNEINYYTYENINSIAFGNETEVTIASLNFTASQVTTVKILHEFIFNIVKNLKINGGFELRYYYDNTLIGYKPVESLSALIINTEVPVIPEGEENETEPVEADIQPVNISITRDYFYILKNVTPNIRHSWIVKIYAYGIESGVINTNNARVVLEGQRLFSDSHFDGFIDAKDNFAFVEAGNNEAVAIGDETPNIDLIAAAIGIGADDLILVDVGNMAPVAIAEGSGVLSPHIYMDGGYFIVNESEEYYLCAEDGSRIITE